MNPLVILAIVLIPVLFCLPFLSSLWYLNRINRNTDKIIKLCTNESSVFYTDVNVWIKGYDPFKRKVSFNNGFFETTYEYSRCDLMLNSNFLMVIGKSTMLGKTINLTPTIFEFGTLTAKPVKYNRNVVCEKITDTGSDLELVFKDALYENAMTFVLINIAPELKEKIKNGIAYL